MRTRATLATALIFFISACSQKEMAEPNFDESLVPAYSLPAILNGQDWYSERRQEIISLYEKEVFGEVPVFQYTTQYKVIEEGSPAFNGKAIRRQVSIGIYSGNDSLDVNVLVYKPTGMKQAPVFLGYNFYGNHTILSDGNIVLTGSWLMNNEKFGINKNRANDASRGVRAHRWPVEMIIDQGYALATVYYGDIDPDFDDGFRNGIHGISGRERGPADWGAISAWAWGLSRVLDYFENDMGIDEDKVVVLGHSRLGKTALWAGALDTRFSMVISNESGLGGAKLYRRRFGETVERMNRNFPHWFCGNFKSYEGREDELPVDQHMLVGLIAPRPVYIASASEDTLADPRGEFLSACAADTVYKYLGTEGIKSQSMPAPNESLPFGTIGYHLREGKHDITIWDWKQFLDFADFHFKGS